MFSSSTGGETGICVNVVLLGFPSNGFSLLYFFQKTYE